jgi:predicted RNA methylase
LGRSVAASQPIELVARRVLRGSESLKPHEERVATYRAGTRLYLQLLALELAVQAGRVSFSGIATIGLGDDCTLRSSTTECLHQLDSVFGEGKTDPGSDADLLVRDAVLEEAPLLLLLLAAVRATAAGVQSPSEKLSGTYEELLTYAPADTQRFSLEKSGVHAKRHGTFYTKPALARVVVEGALRPVRDRLSERASPFRLLDPSMGSGVFLLEAVNALVRLRAGTPAEVAETHVYGYDVDPLAVEVAVLSLWIETGARLPILAQHLRRLDPVWNTTGGTDDRFEVVIGNPPWGAVYTPAERKVLGERWRLSSLGSFDSFKLFLELAAEISDGTIGMIVPRAVLSQATHAGVRELLLRRFAPYDVRALGADEFPRAVAPACSLIFGPKPGPAMVTCRVESTGNRTQEPAGSIPARYWTRDRFPLSDGALLDVLDRLCRHHPRIADLEQLYRVRDVGINYNRASVARRILYEGRAEHPSDLPRYRGRNFARYGAIRQGGWLRHDAHLRLQPGEQLYLGHETYRLPEKIVFRQTADRITATLDRTRMAMGRSVIAITGQDDASLLPLLACLNSELFTRLYRALAGEEGRVLPQVKVRTISMLPLPSACLDVRGNAAWVNLGEMARTRLACHAVDVRMDAEIDRAVCALFGLPIRENGPIVTDMSP